MFKLDAKNSHGDFYHEEFKTLDELFDFISNTIGENNLVSFKARFIPCNSQS